ncbi:hypothetical protein BJV77DRAFT_1071918 [Russula vinacea]|nr:hypothetical protein BJV77DRAFT_1071918 [Russula vinacea]
MEDHTPTQFRIQRLLTSLGESIVDKPPYTSGVLRLPKSSSSLFYKVTGEDGNAARHIDLGNATSDELEKLTQACEPATFGLNQEDVLDETYRKAGKMDPECFSLMLDVGNFLNDS